MTSLPDLQRLFLHQQFRVMDYIHGLVRHVHDAEDLFQEVSVTILNKDPATVPSEPEQFGAWCRGIARNHIMHHWRSRGRARVQAHERIAELADLAFTEAEAAAEGDGDGVYDFAHRQALAGCLERLPDDGKQLLHAHYAEGQTSADLARRARQSAGSVRMQILRLRDRLRACIEARLGPGGVA